MLRSMATSLSISWSSPERDAPTAWAWLTNCHAESRICIMGALARLNLGRGFSNNSWVKVLEIRRCANSLGNLLGAFDHDTWRRVHS